MFSTCPHNMVNFGPLMAEIGSGVWVTPANFNGFRVLAALAKFHYASWFGAGSKLVRSWFESDSVMEFGFYQQLC